MPINPNLVQNVCTQLNLALWDVPSCIPYVGLVKVPHYDACSFVHMKKIVFRINLAIFIIKHE